MGLETVCTVLYGGESYEPKVLLETEAVICRGALKKTFRFSDMSQVVAEDDALSFRHKGASVEIRVGEKAAVWAEKIKNPKGLLDKLGVKAGDEVALVGVMGGPFREQLSVRTDNVSEGVPNVPVPWIFFQADSADALSDLADLRSRITPNGAIWVLHPKGRQDIKDLHVFAAAKAAGLVDVKVAGFSASHSAIKLVIPLNQRP